MIMFLRLSCLLFAASAASGSGVPASGSGGTSSSVGPSSVGDGDLRPDGSVRAVPTEEATTAPAPPPPPSRTLLQHRTTALPWEGGWVRSSEKWVKSNPGPAGPVEVGLVLGRCQIPQEVRQCVERFLDTNNKKNVVDAWIVAMDWTLANKGKGGKGWGKAGKGGVVVAPPPLLMPMKGMGKQGGGRIRQEDVQEPVPLLEADPLRIHYSEDQAGLWYTQLPAFAGLGYLWCPRGCGRAIRFTPSGLERFVGRDVGDTETALFTHF